jgi:hypothetical protein
MAKKKRIWPLFLLLLLVVCLGAGCFVMANGYQADEEAMAVTKLEYVEETEEGGYLLSSSQNQDTALIFYPGARVQAEAYLPLLDGLCQKGLTCYLVEMPLNMAFFGVNKAEEIIENHPEIKHWYLAGHSLGGAMASQYANENLEKIDGLILLGSYLYKPFPIENTLTIYGSLNTSVKEEVKDYTANVIEIEGGNHAQFGNYGKQDGDADALISREEQQNVTIEAVTRFLSENKKTEVDNTMGDNTVVEAGMDFSVPMALVDYIPVLFFAIAGILLMKMLYKRMTPAAFALFATGIINITCAGGLKATYKLLYALGICNFEALSNMFFPVQSIGFLLAGLGMLLMMFGKKKQLNATMPPLFTGTFVFVGIMVAGLGIMDAVLCYLSAKLKKKGVILFFVLSFICSLAMGYLSSQNFAEASMNWIAEGVNVVGQGSLLLGVLKLKKAGLAELE